MSERMHYISNILILVYLSPSYPPSLVEFSQHREHSFTECKRALETTQGRGGVDLSGNNVLRLHQQPILCGWPGEDLAFFVFHHEVHVDLVNLLVENPPHEQCLLVAPNHVVADVDLRLGGWGRSRGLCVVRCGDVIRCGGVRRVEKPDSDSDLVV